MLWTDSTLVVEYLEIILINIGLVANLHRKLKIEIEIENINW